MLSGPMTFIAVTMIINALKMIDLVLVMTKGAPRGRDPHYRVYRLLGDLQQ